MRLNQTFLKRTIVILLVIGFSILMFSITGSHSVLAMASVTINWGDLSPDMGPDPDFVQNDTIASEINTYLAGGPTPHTNPFHGLGSSTGGLSGFSSQSFTNVNSSGVDLTVYYSDNNYDGPNLEGPDLYNPSSNPNPDSRVTGDWLLRETRDHIETRTPTTVVLVFSEPVYMEEFIVGSLSIVGSSYEHAIIRAFGNATATGSVVKASEFINISNLTDCSTLLHAQCNPGGPPTPNALNNIVVEPSLTDSDNDGVYENIGSAADDGVYHVFGNFNQNLSRYGRVKVVYGTIPIQSIAISFFPTATASFTDTAYTDQWISTIIAPFTFNLEDPTAISLGEASASAQNTALFIVVGLVLIGLALLSGWLITHKQTVTNR